MHCPRQPSSLRPRLSTSAPACSQGIRVSDVARLWPPRSLHAHGCSKGGLTVCGRAGERMVCARPMHLCVYESAHTHMRTCMCTCWVCMDVRAHAQLSSSSMYDACTGPCACSAFPAALAAWTRLTLRAKGPLLVLPAARLSCSGCMRSSSSRPCASTPYTDTRRHCMLPA